jgi:transposase
MARYKSYDYGQTKLLPVSFERQVMPGTFEYTLSHLIDREIDMSVFEARYRNDETGAPAYDPAILLKVVLLAYSRGVTGSRQIARLCEENVLFMALSADTQPHFTTIADFIAGMAAEVTQVFRDVLLVCDEAGLIGREMFAVDGVKLPSNASKEWSGTRADYQKKVEKMERAVGVLMRRQREADAREEAPEMTQARVKQVATLKRAIGKVKGFLATCEDKVGSGGRLKQSNITDNDSAKMKGAHGVIQGYDGVAVVDAKHQVVVQAAAFGEAQEQQLLMPMVEATAKMFAELSDGSDIWRWAALTADAGYHSDRNMQSLAERGVDAYVADKFYRRRDPRFKDAARHVPRKASAPWARPTPKGLYQPSDFIVDADFTHCICPAGKRLYRNGGRCRIGARVGVKFAGALRDCRGCALRARCLRHPERTPTRQVVFFLGRRADGKPNHAAAMKQKIDTERGRHQYSRRLGIVEPVFANVCSTRGLRRFTLRGREKVNAQWMLYCLVHNIGKLGAYAGEKAVRRR